MPTDPSRYFGLPPAIKDARAAELFSHGLDPLPEKGHAILIVASDWCPHCHDMAKNTRYATHAAKDMPVRWLNDAQMRGHEYLMKFPGMTVLEDGWSLAVNGQPITNYPTLLQVTDGKIVGMLSGAREVTQKGALDAIADALATKSTAHAQARDAVKDSCKITSAVLCETNPHTLPAELTAPKTVPNQDRPRIIER